MRGLSLPSPSLCCSQVLPRRSRTMRYGKALGAGGYVLLIRHASTDPGAGDPPGFKIDDCATQRNLNAAGREEARRLGARSKRGIAVREVLSSRWCRCIGTAHLRSKRRPHGPRSTIPSSVRSAQPEMREVRRENSPSASRAETSCS